MKKLIWGKTFKRAYRRIIKRKPEIKDDIINTLRKLTKDSFLPALETHKLHGELAGSWACSVNYDIRIVFDFVRYDKDDAIFLIEIGSHEEVY